MGGGKFLHIAPLIIIIEFIQFDKENDQILTFE